MQTIFERIAQAKQTETRREVKTAEQTLRANRRDEETAEAANELVWAEMMTYAARRRAETKTKTDGNGR